MKETCAGREGGREEEWDREGMGWEEAWDGRKRGTGGGVALVDFIFEM